MNIIKKVIAVLPVCFLILCNVTSIKAEAKDYSKKKYDQIRWEKIKKDYLNTETDRLIFVKYEGGSNATVEMWKKVSEEVETASGDTATEEATDQPANTGYEYEWEKILSCKAYVGQNGINKKRQGDRKTPVGIYHITMAFVRKK